MVVRNPFLLPSLLRLNESSCVPKKEEEEEEEEEEEVSNQEKNFKKKYTLLFYKYLRLRESSLAL